MATRHIGHRRSKIRTHLPSDTTLRSHRRLEQTRKNLLRMFPVFMLLKLAKKRLNHPAYVQGPIAQSRQPMVRVISQQHLGMLLFHNHSCLHRRTWLKKMFNTLCASPALFWHITYKVFSVNLANVFPSPAPTDEPSPVVSTPQDSPNSNPRILEPSPGDIVQHLSHQIGSAHSTSAPANGGHNHSRQQPQADAAVNLADQRGQLDASFSTAALLMRENGFEILDTNDVRPVSPWALPFGVHQALPTSEPAPSRQAGSATQAATQQVRSPTSLSRDLGQSMTNQVLETSHGESNGKPSQRTDHGNEQPATWQVQCLQVLNVFIQGGGGMNALSPEAERPRFSILQKACSERDRFYLELHQIFCLWSVDKARAYALLRAQPKAVDEAFEILQILLKHNNLIRPRYLEWFSTFPTKRLVRTDSLARLEKFLVSLCTRWPPMVHSVKSRRYPLLVLELTSQLHLTSVVLLPIFFTASRRHLGVGDSWIANSMHDLFEQDYRRNAHSGQVDEKTNDFYLDLIQQYKALISTATSQKATTHMQQSPSTGSPTMSQCSRMVEQAGPGAGQATTNDPPCRQPSMQSTMSHDPYRQASQIQAAAITGRVPSPVTSNNGFPSIIQSPLFNSPVVTNLVTGHHTSPSIPHAPQGFPLTSQGGPTHLVQGGHHSPQTPHPMHGQNAPNPAQPGNNFIHGPTQASQQYLAGSVNTHRLSGNHLDQQPQPNWDPFGYQATIRGLATPPAQTVPLPQGAPQSGPVNHQTLPPQRQSQPQQGHAHPAALTNPVPQQHLLQLATDQFRINQGLDNGQPQTTMLSQYALQSPVQSQRQVPFPSTLLPAFQGQHPDIAQGLQRRMPRRREGYVMPEPGYQIQLSDYPHDPYDRKSLQQGLHQSHVRSPRRIPKGGLLEGGKEKYYQFVSRFAVEPLRTGWRTTPLYELSFSVSDDEFIHLNRTYVPPNERLPVSEYFNGSLRYRMRICALPRGISAVNEAEWVTSPLVWPQNFFVQFNGMTMSIRRKQHNGKDQPLELTSFVTPGNNVLKAVIKTPVSPGNKDLSLFVAIETVETLSHTSVIDLIKTNGFIEPEVTKDRIRQRLAATTLDDDDVALAQADLSVDVSDPFSLTMWETPARGSSCQHLECFDLKYWLETRPTKPQCDHPKAKGNDPKSCDWCFSLVGVGEEPTLPDKWNCPIPGCNRDARPQSLRIDGFMLQIRQQLIQQGKPNTKSILVSADGSWRPNVVDDDTNEEDDSDSDVPVKDSRKRRRSMQVQAANPKKMPKSVEVIELD
jgi:zinc finger MIZ domain-containing protein